MSYRTSFAEYSRNPKSSTISHSKQAPRPILPDDSCEMAKDCYVNTPPSPIIKPLVDERFAHNLATEPDNKLCNLFQETALSIFKRLLSNTGSEEANNEMKLDKELGNLITHKTIMNSEDMDTIVKSLSLTQFEKEKVTKCPKLEKLKYFSREDLEADDPNSEFKLFAFYWERLDDEIGKIAVLKAIIPRNQITQEFYPWIGWPIKRTSIQLNQGLILKVLDRIDQRDDN